MDRRDGYLLAGTMLEVYEPAPFWAANGSRRAGVSSVSAWLLDEGCIADTVVSGIAVVTLRLSSRGPGEHGGRLILVEEEARPEQVRWIVDALLGRLGGPLADAAALLPSGPPDPAPGWVPGFYQVPINYRFQQRSAVVEVPRMLRVVAAGANLEESDFERPAAGDGTGSGGGDRLWPDWGGQATEATIDIPDLHLRGDLSGCAALRGCFRFEG
jgi:uncharacterized protein DUF1326